MESLTINETVIPVLTERSKFLAVMQGGVIKAGSLGKPFPTVVTSEKRAGDRLTESTSQRALALAR